MKTINIDEATHRELKSLSKSHQKTMVDFIKLAVLFFKQTGINPENPQAENPQKAIRELSKRTEQIIGVIKAHEQDKLNPLLETIMMLVRRTEMMLNDAPKETSFKSIISRMETMMDEDQKYHLEQMKAQHKFYTESIGDILKKYVPKQTE